MRVDHWAELRDRSVGPITRTKLVDNGRDKEISRLTTTLHVLQTQNKRIKHQIKSLRAKLLEREKEIAHLCAELRSLGGCAPIQAAKRIADAVAAAHHLSFTEMISQRRELPLVRARHEAMWLLKKNTMLTLTQIARLLGRSDHTTVLHGIAQHEKRMGAK